MKIKRTCVQCNREILVKPFEIKRGGGKFCSRKCNNKKRNFEKGNRVGMGNKSRTGLASPNKGKRFSIEYRKKLSDAHKGLQTKEKNPAWKGGVSRPNSLLRKGLEYKLWRRAIFERDGFTCQKYKVNGGFLIAHHINNFSEFPELRLTIDNGITLSDRAHREFHKRYGIKNNTKEQLQEFLL